jgi:hypothetical protein
MKKYHCIVCNTKEAWNTTTDAEDKRDKIQALSLAKECYARLMLE